MSSYDTNESQNEQAVYTFISFAVGNIIGASLLALIQDRYGYRTVIMIIGCIGIIFDMILIWINENERFTWTSHLAMIG